MKKCILLLFLCITTVEGRAQFLSQNAEGRGSIILPLNGVGVGFDIGKSEISVGVNNYSEALRKNNNKPFRNWFIGANLAVKNSSGIGNLFQSGDIVPASNLLGFLGFNLNNNEKLLKDWNSSNVVKAKRARTDTLEKLFKNFRLDVASYVDSSSHLIEDKTFSKTAGTAYKDSIAKSPDLRKLRIVIAIILADKDKRLEKFNISFKNLIEQREKILIQSYTVADEDKIKSTSDSAFNTFTNTHKVKRLSPFIFGGIDARNFSLYTGLNSTSLSKSFTDSLYRGGVFGVGINGQIGTFWLGISYAYIDGDNFINLTSKEYTLRTTDVVGNQTLISEKKITGYSGKYAKVESNQLNIDLLKEFVLGDTSRLITNIYYRGSLASRDTAYLKNISNLGLGLYFLGNKSKFLGGLYVELPDINNNIEKAKPESERSIRPPLKKLTIGIMTKFSINSVLGFLNRPRKPD